MEYSIVAAPTVEPIGLNAAKLHIKAITGETVEDNDIISPIIAAAREYCENVTGRALAVQTIEAYPNGFAKIMQLPRPPLVSVTSVMYTDADGNEIAMDASNYIVDTAHGRIAIKEIPSFAPATLNPIKITYVAGKVGIPSLIRQAMLLLIGHWYSNREAVVIGAVASVEISYSVTNLLRQYKVWWL
jgi:uncharacterized phiE125 gp8 family phage protein